MGWRSDWLYRLIFDEVASLWAQAQKEGAGKFGPPPDRFYIQQYAGVQWEQLACQPPVLRTWAFDEHSGLSLLPTPPTPDRTVRGMFFVDGAIHFHLTDDRKRLLWSHLLGPRYGRRRVLRVGGQGRRAILERDPTFGEWIS